MNEASLIFKNGSAALCISNFHDINSNNIAENDSGFVFARSLRSSTRAQTRANKIGDLNAIKNEGNNRNSHIASEGTTKSFRTSSHIAPSAKRKLDDTATLKLKERLESVPLRTVAPRKKKSLGESLAPHAGPNTPITQRRSVDSRYAVSASTDGRRRSSLRGKRASTIGNGFIAMPHPDIETSDFYKHIAASTPEPIRMKQLLVWCARRAVDKLSSSKMKETSIENASPYAVAKAICDEIIQALVNNEINTSWYNRTV